ncbi:patatin-like phospholipase family protein [Lysobacter sp. MMG2]|uniref:patatin-like phospholipase family protein n=1 Tax=Lysobacter sp. MMG2 TaxID=2801338 RepID=UPI001C22C859|nr:patatin-like phospholipase family protein [Lysobacter sp. MMG2]
MTDETGTGPAAGRVYATQCDLVMKGGITSGIVYPLAVVEIAKAFTLRSIGGTSAGAIAAAAAAAAELGRQRLKKRKAQNDFKGFELLQALPTHLVKPSTDGRGTKLMAFFKPAPALRPLFDVFLAVMGTRGSWRRAWAGIKALLPHFGLDIVLGMAIGGVPIGWAVARSGAALVWPWALAGAVIGGMLVLLFHALRLALRELPANKFGACSGMPADGDNTGEALTVWLTDYLDELCGQAEVHGGADGKPLTFGDLRAHDIDLQMMTTCLTLGRPFRLPFRDDPQVRENKQFYYKETEFASLFPERVMAWMHAHERPAGAPGPYPPGYRRLTMPDDMPVVVAVRMSLSFPLLLSAIPLHSVDYNRRPDKKDAADAEPIHELETCWFTDGGVGSNFPIHFFDSALPCRPTFGLDLGRAEEGQEERVLFPKDNGDARLCWWRRFGGSGFAALADFLGAVIHVAKDWNHETLSHLPGFRDRIGLIQLTKKEGGLNLSMDEDLIGKLTGYGRKAGIEFVERFGDPQFLPAGKTPHEMGWGNHQIIRLRLLLASMAELLGSLEGTCSELDSKPADYARFFCPTPGSYSYRFKGLNNLKRDAQGCYYTQGGLALGVFKRLRRLARLIEKTNVARPDTRLDLGAPRPTPELKTRPRV